MRTLEKSYNNGFSLIELMLSIVLGALIIAGVASVFVSNKQAYRTNQGLSEVQESTRTAFELMARDIRTAGLTGCVNNGRIGNVLNNGSTAWWANWGVPLIGYDDNQVDPSVTIGTATGNRLANTDSVAILSAEGTGLSIQKHNPTAATFFINEKTTDVQKGDIIVVCDPDHATIMQVTNYNSSNVSVVHNTGTGTPGNCSKGLGFPTDCSSVNGNGYEFGPNSQISRIAGIDWYVGVNAQGGSSLFRTSLVTNSGAVTTSPTSNEMVRNVSDMQIQYHISGVPIFVNATGGTVWANVDAVRVTLTMNSENNVTVDRTPLTRTFISTTTIRNRVD